MQCVGWRILRWSFSRRCCDAPCLLPGRLDRLHDLVDARAASLRVGAADPPPGNTRQRAHLCEAAAAGWRASGSRIGPGGVYAVAHCDGGRVGPGCGGPRRRRLRVDCEGSPESSARPSRLHCRHALAQVRRTPLCWTHFAWWSQARLKTRSAVCWKRSASSESDHGSASVAATSDASHW